MYIFKQKSNFIIHAFLSSHDENHVLFMISIIFLVKTNYVHENMFQLKKT
jgi:hypothetical protein